MLFYVSLEALVWLAYWLAGLYIHNRKRCGIQIHLSMKIRLVDGLAFDDLQLAQMMIDWS